MQRRSLKENLFAGESVKNEEGEKFGNLRVQQMFADFTSNGPFNTVPNNKKLMFSSATGKSNRLSDKTFVPPSRINKQLPNIKSSTHKNCLVNKTLLGTYNSVTSFDNTQESFNSSPPSAGLAVAERPIYTPEKVLKLFPNHLTDYEKKEILDYSKVYYFGKIKDSHESKATLQQTSPKGTTTTTQSTFTDSNGMYRHSPHDHLAYRYEVMSLLGKGGFGQVLKTYDHKRKMFTAVKMIKSGSKYYKMGQDEIKILYFLGQQDEKGRHNIVSMLNNFCFRGHVCISFEPLGISLYELLKRKKFKGLSLSVVNFFAHSILKCLDLLFRNRLIHGDIKPENVLLKGTAPYQIKVIDFGTSCYENQRVYTYIQTRFYRSPEVLLEAGYGTQIDMWSLACTLGEMFTGRPMFGGENEKDQMARIIEVVGGVPAKMAPLCKRLSHFIDATGVPKYCTTEYDSKNHSMQLKGSKSAQGVYRGPPGSLTLSSLLSTTDPTFLDFISRCLCMDPSERMNPVQALKHPWIRRPSTSSCRGLGADRGKVVSKFAQRLDRFSLSKGDSKHLFGINGSKEAGRGGKEGGPLGGRDGDKSGGKGDGKGWGKDGGKGDGVVNDRKVFKNTIPTKTTTDETAFLPKIKRSLPRKSRA